MNEKVKTIFIIVLSIALCIVSLLWTNDRARLGAADTELDRYRASVDELQRANGELERANIELVEAARNLRGTIVDAHAKARGIADSLAELSNQGGSLTEQLRRVIAALKTIQERIRDLENSLLN